MVWLLFFGQPGVLECTDPTYPAYTGGSLSSIHGSLQINLPAFTQFNSKLIGVLNAAKVTAQDQASVLAVLQSTQPSIVTVNTTFCDKYAFALNLTDVALVTSVVGATVTAVVAPTSPIKIFFDGTQPAGSLNFLDPANGAALTALENGLVAFFGMAGVLGCTDEGYPTYTGGTLASIHQPMMINDTQFDFFVTSLLNVLTADKVAAGDVAAVNAVLQTTRSAIVFAASTTSTGSSGTTTTGGNNPTPEPTVDGNNPALYQPSTLTPGAVAAIAVCSIIVAVLVAVTAAAGSYFLNPAPNKVERP